MRTTCYRSVLALAVLASFALAGCSAHTQLATQAVSFNRTVEKAQNEMLLLNVIRAKERLPMYLTGISGLTGNLSTSLTGTLGGTYTGTGQKATGNANSAAPGVTVTDTLARAYTPSFGGTVSANPTFTLAVLDTQEFMRGFLTPLGKDTLNYYWTQGWPQALLIYLFVQRVEIKVGDGVPVVKENYPDSSDIGANKLQGFGDWVQTFLAQKPDIEEVPSPVDIGPLLPEKKVANLGKLVEMTKEGLVLTPSGKAYQLQKKQSDFRFKFGKPDKCATAPEKSEVVDSKKREYLQNVTQDRTKMTISNNDSETTTFFLRSPEAILYYLGELMRLANRKVNPLVAYVCIQDRLQPLFVARPAGTCPSTLIDAETAQERFAIPKSDPENLAACKTPGSLELKPPACDTGRSMQGLSFLNQVISLQKSAKDNPGTALVRIVGN